MTVTRSCPVCGYTGSYPSQAMADARHRRHSCAKQQHVGQVARRRAARAEQRRERPCRHPHARHTHGSRAAYVRDQCRCPACTAANTAASRTVYRQRAYGRWQPYLDATPVRGHLQALRQTGIGVDRIAALAGTSVSHIRELADPGRPGRPPIRRVRPETAQRILAVTATDATRAPRSHLAATGSRRRLQALVALGWPLPHLADELGRSPSNLSRSMTAGSVTAATAQQVRDLYHRLTRLSPPQTTAAQRTAAHAARAHAHQHGWRPPLGWDDIDTDPNTDTDTRRPGEQPADPDDPDDIDEIAVERAVAGDGIHLTQLTPAEQTEAVRRLTAHGASLRDIAAQLATTTRTVSRRRRQLRAA